MNDPRQANKTDTMTLPNFVHGFPEFWQHRWEYEEGHSIQSGLHVEIDIILDKLQHRPMWRIRKSKTLTKLLKGLISFVWGINCHYPPMDVMRFVIWEYQKFPTINSKSRRMDNDE